MSEIQHSGIEAEARAEGARTARGAGCASVPGGGQAAGARPGGADAAGSAADHVATSHAGQPTHHHHSHAATSVHAGGHHLLQLDDVSVGFERYAGRGVRAPRETRFVIEHLSLSLHEGEILALVGASGSGKTLIADAIMGLFASNAYATGRIWFDGALMDARALAALRGRQIAFVPQSIESLDPLQRVGRQIEQLACGMGKREAASRRSELFARYRLDEDAARRYPFELSGGMARRMLLIGALMNRPRVIVADEPTPGLDMELAVQAMGDFRAFANDGGAVLLITHDIELALRVADRIAVFEDGTVVEETAVANFASPELLRHPFSRVLWHALPEHGMHVNSRESEGTAREEIASPALGSNPETAAGRIGATAPAGAAASSAAPSGSAARAVGLQARGIGFGYGSHTVLEGVDLSVAPGERVALRAPSGTGKTTLCRILAGYLAPSAGAVTVDGAPAPRRGASPVQLIAQHPERMMDPAITVRRSLAEATIEAQDAAALAAWEARTPPSDNCSPVPALLDALGVQPAWLERFPSELSGGELQRCCIARALIARPRYLICDEISTMLDAATQAYLWRFLIAYAQQNGIGMVVVTHSDALLDHIATRIVDLERAKACHQSEPAAARQDVR